MSDVKERLLAYLRAKGEKQVDFTRRLGVSAAYIGAMRKGISSAKMRQIRELYPDLNPLWLLYGEGNMIGDGESGIGNSGVVAMPDAQEVEARAREMFEVPLLPVSAYAGGLQQYSEGVALRDCEKVVSPVKGADFAIRVSGDSMEPELHDGSTILIKRINDRAFIPWGSKMVIDTENGVLVKSVYPGEGDSLAGNGRYGAIEARSLNPKYPPIRIPSGSIYGLYRILGCVTLFTTL